MVRIYPKANADEAAQQGKSQNNVDRYGGFVDQKVADAALVFIEADNKLFTILHVLHHNCEVEVIGAIGTYVKDWGQLCLCFIEVDEANEAVCGYDHQERANLDENYEHGPQARYAIEVLLLDGDPDDLLWNVFFFL